MSLRTTTFREVEWLAKQLDQEYWEIIERVKENEKNTDISRIVRLYLKQRLDLT